MNLAYEEFLKAKIVKPVPSGFAANEPYFPKAMHGWQAEIARWCCQLGRAAIFAGCGLGKTLISLAWADQVRRHTRKPVLILTPLAVGPQTVREAHLFGVGHVRLVADMDDVAKAMADNGLYRVPVICVTNYQKLLAGKIDPNAFGAVVLDESSILKSYMGSTKRMLIESFAATPYKLACTATPAPNDHMELGNHAEFLGVMPSNEMLSRWFINDGSKVGSYRLKGHGQRDFWQWVASWAVCVDKPSDLGYPDDGYILPELRWHQHVVSAGLEDRTLVDGDGQRTIVPTDRLTATTLHAEMRQTASQRAQAVADLVNPSSERWLIWCNTDYEADALRKRIHDAVEVRGSDSDSCKEDRLTGFSDGRIRVLITKPSIAGFGMNWQHCSHMAFVGLSYSHEQLYQAIRRCWRFGQLNPVDVHVVLAETEGEVLAAIKRKEAGHETMRENMTKATRQQILTESSPGLIRPERKVIRSESDKWQMTLGDCVEVTRDMDANSVDFTIFSPPFAGLYIYSDAQQDMGNCASDEEFLEHYSYLAPELLRVTVPGRLCAVHCKDLPKYAGRDGMPGLKDLPGWLVRLHEEAGWVFHSRVCIWKCPVVERERTNNNGLLHKSVKRDSSQIRQGMADYLLVFRKPTSEGNGLLSDKPIARPEGFAEWHGTPETDPRTSNAHPSPYARKGKFGTTSATGESLDAETIRGSESVNMWRRYAEPVWWDIDQMDTLNEKAAREGQDEKHICPLQIGLIRRSVYLWSLPGELVFSPFAGIGSEGVGSLLERRRFLGIELKPAYLEQAVRNLTAAEVKARQRGLFDTIEEPLEVA